MLVKDKSLLWQALVIFLDRNDISVVEWCWDIASARIGALVRDDSNLAVFCGDEEVHFPLIITLAQLEVNKMDSLFAT